MISGIGTDIVEVARIKALLEKHPASFLDHIFTEKEQAEAAKRKNPAEYYAGRWAVKEAVSKALGSGIGEDCAWRDIETLNDSRGKPDAKLSGDAKKSAAAKSIDDIHVSISHEKHYACAFVVLSCNGG